MPELERFEVRKATEFSRNRITFHLDPVAEANMARNQN
jgi:hypothetical protein